jgi:transcriptional regulator with PAS, ATPase and Fis domain
LENAIEYAVNMAVGELINLESLPPRVRETYPEAENIFRVDAPLKDRVREYEKKVLQHYLDRYGNSYDGKNDIAEKLEISRATLYRKLSELGLSDKTKEEA